MTLDLSLEGMLRKLDGCGLPMSDLSGKQHLLEAIESVAANYRRAAGRRKEVFPYQPEVV